MFKENVGGVDRLIRFALGVALLGLFAFGEGSLRWFGLAGLVPLLTATFSFCPLYSLVGLSTCPATARR